jgi:hypothetical protein
VTSLNVNVGTSSNTNAASSGSYDYSAIANAVNAAIGAGGQAAQGRSAAQMAYDAAAAGANELLLQFQHGLATQEEVERQQRVLQQQQAIYEREVRDEALRQQRAIEAEEERIRRELEARAQATAGSSMPVWGWAIVAAGVLGLAGVVVVSIVKR